MNSESSKTPSSHVLILKITLSNLSISYTWQNIKQFYQTNFIFLKTFNSKFRAIEVWFKDQNSQPIVIEDRVNVLFDWT